MTDQPTLSNRLATAMTRVAEAERYISAQAAHVAEMERDEAKTPPAFLDDPRYPASGSRPVSATG
jgi:hypothetical protein